MKEISVFIYDTIIYSIETPILILQVYDRLPVSDLYKNNHKSPV